VNILTDIYLVLALSTLEIVEIGVKNPVIFCCDQHNVCVLLKSIIYLRIMYTFYVALHNSFLFNFPKKYV
jgi:hypothetical protein